MVSTKEAGKEAGRTNPSRDPRRPCYAAMMLRIFVCPVLFAVLLSSCASGDYPSLARRDAERVSGSAAPVSAVPDPAPVITPSTTGLSGRLAALVGQAQEAHRQFIAGRSRAESSVSRASGAAVASESWSLANVALADLESSRSNAMIALAELDAVFTADRIAHFDTPSSDAEAIAAARDQVSGWVEEEDRILAALRGRIRS